MLCPVSCFESLVLPGGESRQGTELCLHKDGTNRVGEVALQGQEEKETAALAAFRVGQALPVAQLG